MATAQMVEHPSGTYRFYPAISAYSAGFAVAAGYEITALRLLNCTSLVDGFSRIDAEISRRGLSSASLAGLQLRSPGAFSFDEFANFNAQYIKLLSDRSIILNGVNPVSRTNVIPVQKGPPEPIIKIAFIVHPSRGVGGSDFVIAGAGEVAGDLGPENIIARGDLSLNGLNLKVECVLEIMCERLSALGFSNDSPTTINVYTKHKILDVAEKIAVRLPSVAQNGYTSWLTKPPVVEIEFEMDCSRYSNWVAI
jgi:hypothetical protein